MKQVTTITLTFELTHKKGEEGIVAIRSLINKLCEYDDDGQIEVITDNDTGDYTFVRHNEKYSHQFGFGDIDTFVKKYAKTGGSCGIATIIRDYGKFISCESKTKEVEDAEQQ